MINGSSMHTLTIGICLFKNHWSLFRAGVGWGLAQWPMKWLYYASVDQSKARRNKGEKLTVQGKLIGTDTQILSVCVCVSQDFRVSVTNQTSTKKNLPTFSKGFMLSNLSANRKWHGILSSWPDVTGKLDEANIWFPPVSVRWSALGLTALRES